MQNVGDMHEFESSNGSVSSTSAHSGAPTATQPPVPEDEKYTWGSLILTVLVILAIAFGIRFYVLAPYLVEGASMEETFHPSDYLMVDRISYRFSEPARGDVIVLKFPLDTSRSFIKRVIGLPGERVEMEGQSVTIFNDANPAGITIDESYISPRYASDTELSVTLGEGEYFVLGDNRAESADSRYWGVLPREDIVGKPLIRLFPLNRIEIFPGEARYTSASESAEQITE